VAVATPARPRLINWGASAQLASVISAYIGIAGLIVTVIGSLPTVLTT
jgi:hypothetical protein